MDFIPFNRPYLTGQEMGNIEAARGNNILAGDGPFSERCHAWLEARAGSARALLTHSCTAALEMAAILFDIRPGDEIIMPAYTFVSTANAFVLRGGVPVFVDIREDTLNIDETLIEAAITPRTKAIVVVHYAGVACEMDAIMNLARRRGLRVLEDAAQGITAKYKGRELGSIGDLGAYSFHETKNVISGEGGALLVNDRALAARAEVIWEKGTDRSAFFRGQVDRYTWQDIGSSYLPGELVAAFLWAQLGEADRITRGRLASWERYHALLRPLELSGLLRRPSVPSECRHNAHMYYVLLPRGVDRERVLGQMKSDGIGCIFHYVPLHSAPAGKRYARVSGAMRVTEDLSERLIRLPLWIGLSEEQQVRVARSLERHLTDQIESRRRSAEPL